MNKDTARQRVRDAVRHGKLVKPANCSDCGAATEARQLHGHHANGYSDPLDVQWICIRCHNRIDRELIAANGMAKIGNLARRGRFPGAKNKKV